MRNRGWFQKGADPRRHQFTPEERRRGGKAAFATLWQTHPKLARWLLEHRIKDPQQRAKTHQGIQALIQEKLELQARRDWPDDIPY
jgi:hypothetical protein